MNNKVVLCFIFNCLFFQARAQQTFIKLSGRTSQDLYYDMSETPDGGILFGGTFHSDYSFTKCTSNIDTLWTALPYSMPDVNLYSSCSLSDGRLAIAGTYNNQSYEEAVLIVTDSAGNLINAKYIPSSAWGNYGNNVYPMQDSGLIMTSYEDGYTCSNTINTYRYDKFLDPVWESYQGTCDAFVLYSDGFDGNHLHMNFLRVNQYYYDSLGNWHNNIPELITIDTSGTHVFDSLYFVEKNYTGISNVKDGGVILFGSSDTLGNKEVFIMKISSSGDIEWNNTFGSPYDDIPVDVVETNDNGFAILSTRKLPGTNTGVDMDFYKTTSTGQLQFSQTYGSTGNEDAIQLLKKIDGSILILGRTNGFGYRVNMIIQLDSTGHLNPDYQIISANNHYCTGDTAILGVSPPAMHYQWSTGDTTPTIQVTTNKNIELTVVDSNGISFDVPFFSVYFDNPPSAVINGTTFSICGGQSAQLTVPSGTGNSYQWFLNGTLIDTANYRIYNASVSGIYQAVVSNACGIDSSLSATVSAHPNPPAPQVSIFPSVTVCSPATIVLSVPNNGDSILWTWSGNSFNGDTLILSSAANYFLSVKAIDVYGCISPSQSLQARIDTTPFVNLTDSIKKICTPGSTMLPYTSSAAYGTFTYLLNGNTTGSSPYPQSFYAYGNGLYEINLSNSCGSYSDSVIVIANPKPAIDIFPDTPQVCAGIPILLTCLSKGVYEWRDNNYNLISTDSICLTNGFSTNYTYYYFKLTDTITSCISSINIPIYSVPDSPVSMNAIKDTVLCPSGEIILDPGNFNSYLWSTGDNSPTITIYHPGAADTAFYTVTVVDSFHCSTTDTIRVIFDLCNSINENLSQPEISVYPNPSSEIMVFELTGDNVNALFYLYDFTGKQILSANFDGNKLLIDTRDFSAAHYFYLVRLKEVYIKGSVDFIR